VFRRKNIQNQKFSLYSIQKTSKLFRLVEILHVTLELEMIYQYPELIHS